jgi:hypothetical protein
VRFYVGDPDNGGQLIVNSDGISESMLDRVNARELIIARLENWIVPESFKNEKMIFAVVDPDNLVDDVHGSNNKAWNLISSGFDPSTNAVEVISQEEKFIPDSRFRLFPNPVQSTATFEYAIESNVQVELSILDMQGRKVKNLFVGTRMQGIYQEEISVKDLDPGIYFYHFKTGSYFESGKIMVVE